MMSAIKFSVYIKPNAKKTKLLGWHNGHVKIAIQAPPAEGKANQALVDFLAQWFEVKKKDISILRGETTQIKLVCIQNTKTSLLELMRNF